MMAMITTTTTNDRSLIPLQTTMTKVGMGGTTTEPTTKDEDVVANTTSEVDEC